MRTLTGKNILIISPESWDHIFVSKHHYAVHLAKLGNKVFFLNPPSDTNCVSETAYANLYSVSYTGFVKGLRYFPKFLQRKIIFQCFTKIERLCKVAFHIAWSFDNSVFFDFSALPSSIYTISHIVDLNQDFQTRSAANTASICFCTTDAILAKLRRYNANAYKINHGYNAITMIRPTPLPGTNKIKAIYAGNLKMRFLDWHTLYATAFILPHVDFVFIGPGGECEDDVNDTVVSKRKIKELRNVYFVGKVSSVELQNFISSADLLLVCYQEKYHEDQANPHKIMEYLSSGKVVVATFTKEYKHHDGLIKMSNENDDFPSLVKEVVGQFDLYNSDVLMKRRKDFAMDNSYERQIERIDAYISSNDRPYAKNRA